MGDGTKENPYTREDVLRLIEENSGDSKSEWLNLSGKVFKEGIDLSDAWFEELILTGKLSDSGQGIWGGYLKSTHLEKSILRDANLERAHLQYAHLEGACLSSASLKGAFLSNAHLENADLWSANLEGATLKEAYLEGAFLFGIKLSEDTKLDYVNWGDHTIGEENEGDFQRANETYRRLKIWHTNAGIYDEAGEFFFREQETVRKHIQKTIFEILKGLFKRFSACRVIPTLGMSLLWLWIYKGLCGYGEKTERVVFSALAIIFGLAAAYYFLGSFDKSAFWDTLYYSVVSFTAVGYGNWAPQPTGWAKGVGAAEAVIGVFMMTLFLVTFTRKMTR